MSEPTAARPGQALRTLAATVLAFESIVVFFGTLWAMTLADLSRGVAGALGGLLVVACLVLIGLLRFRWAYPVGSALQVLVIASGFVVPAMFFLGAVFAALWVWALVSGNRLGRLRDTPAKQE